MGACFTTVYFFRDGRWVTPPAGNGCKEGVSRRWALEHGGVEERIVQMEDVTDREMVWLSSAVGGFCGGGCDLWVEDGRIGVESGLYIYIAARTHVL